MSVQPTDKRRFESVSATGSYREPALGPSPPRSASGLADQGPIGSLFMAPARPELGDVDTAVKGTKGDAPITGALTAESSVHAVPPKKRARLSESPYGSMGNRAARPALPRIEGELHHGYTPEQLSAHIDRIGPEAPVRQESKAPETLAIGSDSTRDQRNWQRPPLKAVGATQVSDRVKPGSPASREIGDSKVFTTQGNLRCGRVAWWMPPRKARAAASETPDAAEPKGRGNFPESTSNRPMPGLSTGFYSAIAKERARAPSSRLSEMSPANANPGAATGAPTPGKAGVSQSKRAYQPVQSGPLPLFRVQPAPNASMLGARASWQEYAHQWPDLSPSQAGESERSDPWPSLPGPPPGAHRDATPQAAAAAEQRRLQRELCLVAEQRGEWWNV